MFSSDIEIWDTLMEPYNYNNLIRKIYFNKKKNLRKIFNDWVGEISKPFKDFKNYTWKKRALQVVS